MENTPDTNTAEIGKLTERVDGNTKLQQESTNSIKKDVGEIKETFQKFVEKSDKHIERLYKKTDQDGKDIVGLKARQKGYEDLSNQQNINLHEKIGEIGSKVEHTINQNYDKLKLDLIAAVSDKKKLKKENKHTWKWIAGLIITAVIAASF